MPNSIWLTGSCSDFVDLRHSSRLSAFLSIQQRCQSFLARQLTAFFLEIHGVLDGERFECTILFLLVTVFKDSIGISLSIFKSISVLSSSGDGLIPRFRASLWSALCTSMCHRRFEVLKNRWTRSKKDTTSIGRGRSSFSTDCTRTSLSWWGRQYTYKTDPDTWSAFGL